jgi:hypothetical protein
MASLTGSLCEWPLIRPIREVADGTGLEAMSDNSAALDHPLHRIHNM